MGVESWLVATWSSTSNHYGLSSAKQLEAKGLNDGEFTWSSRNIQVVHMTLNEGRSALAQRCRTVPPTRQRGLT